MNFILEKFKGLILRPLFSFCAAFYLLYCALFSVSHIVKAVLFAVFAVLLILSVLLSLIIKREGAARSLKRFLCFTFAGVVIASVLSILVFDIYVPSYMKYDGVTEAFLGQVEEVKYDVGYGGYYVVKTEKIGDENVSARVYMFASDLYSENDIIEGSAEFEYINKAESEYYEYKQTYLSDGIILAANATESARVSKGSAGFMSYARKANDYLSKILISQMGKDYGGFSAALLLGNKTNLPDILRRNFSRLGISHILAISGMHLAVIISLISFILKPFGKNARNAILIIAVFAYMFLTGFQSSVTRSGIMTILLILSAFIQKKGDSFTFLGVSVLIISLFNPFSACDIGLQLSFCAVIAVLMTTEKKRGLINPQSGALKTIGNIILPFRISMAVILFLLPIEWLYFDRICYLSPLASVAFSLIATVLLWLLPFQLIFSFFPPLSKLITVFTSALCKLTQYASNKLALMQNITLYLKFAGGLVICVALSVLIVFALTSKRWAKAFFALGCVALFAALIAGSVLYLNKSYDNTVIATANYSNNDAIVLYNSEKTAIIDIGNGYSKTFNKAKKKTEEIGADEVEYLVLTHYHQQYMTSLASVFQRNIIRELYIPEFSEDIVSEIRLLCEENSVVLNVYSYGESIALGNATVSINEPAYIKRSNQPILSIKIEAYSKTFSYVGSGFNDAEIQPEGDVIWYGDHGAKYKNSFSVDGTYVLYPLAAEFADNDDSIYKTVFNREGIVNE